MSLFLYFFLRFFKWFHNHIVRRQFLILILEIFIQALNDLSYLPSYNWLRSVLLTLCKMPVKSA